jgi:pimeloyl-ACP methyl ester carboxylesterase
MGLGTQMIGWDTDFIDLLVGNRLHVVRFDNRDVGLSSKIEDGPEPDVIAALTTGDTSSASYTLDDMAADAAGLLEALGIERAHIAGASMGGMIAQTFAINYPERTLSLCSIMSTTGEASVGQATPETAAVLVRPPATTRDEAIAGHVDNIKIFGSKGLPFDWDRVRERAARAYDRMFYPVGRMRQLVGIRASGDRTARLRELEVPTVVIHGTDDTLITPTGGEATAKAVTGADLVMIEGMGHDLPPAAWEQVVGAIVTNIGRAS